MGEAVNDSILCGDNVEVLRGFPDGCIDLTVTSPPYDKLRAYGGYNFRFEELAKELYRVTKPGGVVVWVVGDATVNGSETGTSFRQALYFQEIGFKQHDTMIWEKTNPNVFPQTRYTQSFEYMFIFSKGKPKTWSPLMVPCACAGKTWKTHYYNGANHLVARSGLVNHERPRGNVWRFSPSPVNAGCFKHPAPFPLQLAKDHVSSWSNPEDLVLDPMCGSGTTCLAAKQLGRRYVGIDCNEEYCAYTRLRLEGEQQVT
jgi:DNA modification methylase